MRSVPRSKHVFALLLAVLATTGPAIAVATPVAVAASTDSGDLAQSTSPIDRPLDRAASTAIPQFDPHRIRDWTVGDVETTLLEQVIQAWATGQKVT